MESLRGENSWKMFRGDIRRTGASYSSGLSKRPHLLWVIELGPLIASPVVDNEFLYASTITGRVFAVHISQRIAHKALSGVVHPSAAAQTALSSFFNVSIIAS